ncbi:uncharacterized protein NPIL_71501 [Nephila pilipes]|uniref:C2H2-type domain-containing protein n=1 Tax=Nephila pilipes TaxID=299642 RepID=A0A8X6TYL2_NEPPI|nr:uncharacterized protein NPIL_71501 [Nephila pilipes]
MDNTCFLCDKSFSTASNLRRHARLTHNVENKVSTCRQMKCNVCSEELVSMKALLDHVESAHYIALEKETKKFDTYEAYKIWKEDVEKQTALYIRNTGSKFNNMKKTMYFYCHCNGIYNARGDKKRTIKMAGSYKINGNCPSKMKVCEDNENQVYVEFTKTHLGHVKDLGRMQITREKNNELARKLEKKIPIQTISDEIQDSFIDKLERIHLVTRMDLLNLKAEYSISSEGIMDINDSCQREMLNFYGNDTICLDFTHGRNAYGFDLATILVLNDKREGFPVAFILSNRQDSKALSLAFVAIKEYVSISPKVMMNDDTESFSNAWRTVFGVPEKRLLSTWHVDRSWRRNISRLIKKPEIQIEAYKVVRCLLIETDEEAFSMMLKEVLKIFSEKDELREFGKYFEHIYSKRTEVWAYCYRKWLGINTNMHIESMHRTINRNLNEINSAVPGDEGLSVHSPIVDEEEMVICEDRKILEKAVLVDNLRATAT